MSTATPTSLTPTDPQLSPETEKTHHNPSQPNTSDETKSDSAPATPPPDAPATDTTSDPSFDTRQSTFDNPSLNPRQLAAIPLLAAGHSNTAVAQHLGVHRTTISQWLRHDPAFAAELARHRADLLHQSTALLQTALDESLNALRNQLRDYNPVVACRAARTLITLSRIPDHLAPPPKWPDP